MGVFLVVGQQEPLLLEWLNILSRASEAQWRIQWGWGGGCTIEGSAINHLGGGRCAKRKKKFVRRVAKKIFDAHSLMLKKKSMLPHFWTPPPPAINNDLALTSERGLKSVMEPTGVPVTGTPSIYLEQTLQTLGDILHLYMYYPDFYQIYLCRWDVP